MLNTFERRAIGYNARLSRRWRDARGLRISIGTWRDSLVVALSKNRTWKLFLSFMKFLFEVTIWYNEKWAKIIAAVFVFIIRDKYKLTFKFDLRRRRRLLRRRQVQGRIPNTQAPGI